MATWWNANYPIRRKLKFVPPTDIAIKTGYPLTAKFNYVELINSNKIRPDFADMQVLHLAEDDTTWTVLPKTVYTSGEIVYLQFNAVEDLEEISLRYYIYLGNRGLIDPPTVGNYISADYVIDTSTNSGIGLSYTRPLEDWDDGLSLKADSRAAFTLVGTTLRFTVQKGPDRGIMQLTLDNESPIYIDTYNPTYTNTIVYNPVDLSLGRHTVRIRVTGDKSPSSSDIAVKIVKFEYSKYVEGIDQGEEINPALTATRIVVGP